MENSDHRKFLWDEEQEKKKDELALKKRKINEKTDEFSYVSGKNLSLLRDINDIFRLSSDRIYFENLSHYHETVSREINRHFEDKFDEILNEEEKINYQINEEKTITKETEED